MGCKASNAMRPILSIELAAYGIERMIGFWQDLVRYWPLGGTTRYLGRGQRDCCQIRVTGIIKCEPPGPWMEFPTSPARPNWETLQKGPSTPISKFGHSRTSPLKRACTTVSELRFQLSLLPLLVTLRENSESGENLPQNDTIWTRLLKISKPFLIKF